MSFIGFPPRTAPNYEIGYGRTFAASYPARFQPEGRSSRHLSAAIGRCRIDASKLRNAIDLAHADMRDAGLLELLAFLAIAEPRVERLGRELRVQRDVPDAHASARPRRRAPSGREPIPLLRSAASTAMRPILAALPLTTIRSVPITVVAAQRDQMDGDVVEFVPFELGRNRLLDHEHLMPHGVHRRHQVGVASTRRCVPASVSIGLMVRSTRLERIGPPHPSRRASALLRMRREMPRAVLLRRRLLALEVAEARDDSSCRPGTASCPAGGRLPCRCA